MRQLPDRHWVMCCALATDKTDGDDLTTWAICWQAAVGREFFVQPSLVARIRDRLIGAHQRSGRVLVNYALLPAEIHIVAHIPRGDSPGGVARAFGNVLSRWVREVHPVRSPVLAGPYQAQPILSLEELRDETRMLAWRPVFLGLCSTPSHYPHGALRIALGLTPAKGFDTRPMLRNFGDSVPDARASLRRWITKRPSEQEWLAWELTRGLELAVGSVGPHPTMARSVDHGAAKLIAAAGAYGIDGALKLLELWIVAKIQPMNGLNLHEARSPVAARGRALVACLAVSHRLCSAASVARHFGRAKATLSEQMSACRARTKDQAILATPLQRIIEESSALLAMVNATAHLPP